jgi:hypothetical protein
MEEIGNKNYLSVSPITKEELIHKLGYNVIKHQETRRLYIWILKNKGKYIEPIEITKELFLTRQNIHNKLDYLMIVGILEKVRKKKKIFFRIKDFDMLKKVIQFAYDNKRIIPSWQKW